MNKLDIYTNLLGDLRQTYIAKNKDYGDSFGKSVRKYGLISALTRMSDKFNRLESLVLNKEQLVENESLQDTLLDLANYCIMTTIELSNNVSRETIDNEKIDVLEYELECANSGLEKYNKELELKNQEIRYFENLIDNKNDYIRFLEVKVCELEEKLTDEMLKEF